MDGVERRRNSQKPLFLTCEWQTLKLLTSNVADTFILRKIDVKNLRFERKSNFKRK